MDPAESAYWVVEKNLTDESIAKHRDRIGKTFYNLRPQYTEVTKDNIRHFANAVGDPNPLWWEEQYAKKTRFRGMVAPPSFVFSILGGPPIQGLPGIHAYHSGSELTFYKPMMLGDVFNVECVFTRLDEKEGGLADRWLVEHYETTYSNQKGDVLARNKAMMVRAERHAMKKSGKYSTIQMPHPWTEEEVKKIEEQALAEQILGSNIRYWEDVKVGQEVPALVKGPLSITDSITWLAGGTFEPLPGGTIALRMYQKHPGWSLWHPDTRAHEFIELVHTDIKASKTTGLPYPYDFVAMRNSWLIESYTHWMGNDGWLKKCSARYYRFLYLSDVVWIRGKVTKKYIDDDGDYCVDIESTAINQRKENSLYPASTTIALPSRENNVYPLDKLLSE